MTMETNKIYSGDSNELIKLLPDNSIDCIYTDIPYLIDKGGSGPSKISIQMKKVEVSIQDFSNGIDYTIFEEYKRVLKKINLFIWCSKNQIKDILNYWTDYGCYFEILTWNKTDPTPMCNNNWLPDTEYCLFFREKGVPLNDGYDLKSKFYIAQKNKKDKELYDHPTIKPLELVERHILHATQENDVILDTFIGSGTTAEACINTQRQFIGFEINEQYYTIATNRIKGITQSELRAKANGLISIYDYL